MAKQIITAMKPTHEQITQRAFEIYRQRGCPEGKDLEHWLEAERQLSAEAPGAPNEMSTSTAETSSRSRTSRVGNGSARKTSARQSTRAQRVF